MNMKKLPAVIKQYYKIVNNKVFYTKLYPDSFYENIKEYVDVILSPEFYWVYKIENIKLSKKEAINLAKNSFEFDDFKNYNFYIFKLENFYLVFALKKDLKLNINKKYIKSIRFSQIEFQEYDNIKINNNFILKKVNNIFYIVPKKFNLKTVDINEVLEKVKLSNYKIKLNKLSINKKDILLYSSLLLLLNIYIGIDFINKKKLLNNLNYYKESFLIKNNLPKTLIQLKSIKKSIFNKNIKRNLFVEDLNYIFQLPLNKKNKEVFLLFNGNYNKLGYDLKIYSNRKFTSYFNKKFDISKENLNNNIYYIRLLDEK